MTTLLDWINYSILYFFIFTAFIYTLILLGSFPALLQFFKRSTSTNLYTILKTNDLPPVTIISPFYNEKNVIENALSALNSDYPSLYVILLNDGSTDDSLERLITAFDLQRTNQTIETKIPTAAFKGLYVSQKNPRLLVIDKAHSGVGDTLNMGLNFCFTPYVVTVDTDSILHERAISELIYEVLSTKDTIAVGGGVYLLNACVYENGHMLNSKMPYRLVPSLQANEYLRSHLFNRTGWNSFGGTMSYSGTATLFKLSELLEVNGFDTNNFAQDTEIVMRLHRHMHQKRKPYQIRFNPAATVWTRVPDTLRAFTIQRDKWRRGIVKSVLPYFNLFLNPRYKIQGLMGYPVYVLLEVLAPFVEFTAYITVGIGYYYGLVSGLSVILYLLLAWGFIAYLTLANMLLNIITFNQYHRMRDIAWMFLLAIIEILGFRQYHTLVKVFGSLHYFFNRLLGKPV